jgi:Cof subfamily protein (haloacid dehalogenase superfamily)
MKGYIALDIDGTITHDKFIVPGEVVSYLKSLYQDDWKVILLTGRSYSFSKQLLDGFDFPIDFVMQNGSAGMSLPGKEELFINYMSKEDLFLLEKLLFTKNTTIIIYSGYKNNDTSYWLKDHLDSDKKDFLSELMRRQNSKGICVDSIKDIDIDDGIALVKFFGTMDELSVLEKKINENKLGETAIIKDPFDIRYHILFITKKGVNKGFALKQIVEKTKEKKPIICAGNDNNDLPMFDVSDIKVAIKDSPSALLEKADIVAPSVDEMGIITGLKKAIGKLNE